jgi:hypothetical protein
MAVLNDWIRLIDATARTDEEVAHAGDPSSEQIMYYTSFMSMGKRTRDWQSAMWVPITELTTSSGHPFYRRLNRLLREHGFDDFAEAQCAGFYAETMGRPSLPPGIISGCS